MKFAQMYWYKPFDEHSGKVGCYAKMQCTTNVLSNYEISAEMGIPFMKVKKQFGNKPRTVQFHTQILGFSLLRTIPFLESVGLEKKASFQEQKTEYLGF